MPQHALEKKKLINNMSNATISFLWNRLINFRKRLKKSYTNNLPLKERKILREMNSFLDPDTYFPSECNSITASKYSK